VVLAFLLGLGFLAPLPWSELFCSSYLVLILPFLASLVLVLLLGPSWFAHPFGSELICFSIFVSVLLVFLLGFDLYAFPAWSEWFWCSCSVKAFLLLFLGLSCFAPPAWS
jgi:hypothetical protein